MNSCCQHLIAEAKKELAIKDARIVHLESEVTRVFEPTREFWNQTKLTAAREIIENLEESMRLISILKEGFECDNYRAIEYADECLATVAEMKKKAGIL